MIRLLLEETSKSFQKSVKLERKGPSNLFRPWPYRRRTAWKKRRQTHRMRAAILVEARDSVSRVGSTPMMTVWWTRCGPDTDHDMMAREGHLIYHPIQADHCRWTHSQSPIPHFPPCQIMLKTPAARHRTKRHNVNLLHGHIHPWSPARHTPGVTPEGDLRPTPGLGGRPRSADGCESTTFGCCRGLYLQSSLHSGQP